MTEQHVQIRVTLQVFSAHSNPSWALTNEEASALKARLRSLSWSSPAEDPRSFLWSHYYQGFVVTAGGAPSLPAETLIIGPYLVADWLVATDRETAFDLQTWLLGTTHSPVTEVLAARVRGALEQVDWGRPPRSFPPFDPGKWAEPRIIDWNNCYNYATNFMFTSEATGASPGASVKQCPDPTNCRGVCLAAQRDGVTLEPTGSPGEITMALAIDPIQLMFHWYRHHPAEGFWSHKLGPLPPQNHDDSGQKVVDVERANRGPYTDFCGYFYSVPGNVCLGPVADCQSKESIAFTDPPLFV